MAVTNGLATLTDVKDALDLDASNTRHDSRLETAIEAASRMIEAECRRKFTPDTSATARMFYPLTSTVVFVDDVSSTSGLVVKTDPGDDGTYDVTVASTDYQLEPLNGTRDGITWPYTTIIAVESTTWPSTRRPSVQVTAKWGWPTVPTDIEQACLVQSVALFKAADAPFGATGTIDGGVLRIRSALHPTAAALVKPFRREELLI